MTSVIAGYGLPADAGCGILDPGFWIRDAGYWIEPNWHF
jgi:hypothetical protein